MILYDGLFEGCQGDFVTSFDELSVVTPVMVAILLVIWIILRATEDNSKVLSLLVVDISALNSRFSVEFFADP
jgi:hypothetical protein